MNTSVTFKLKKPQGEPNLRQQREVLFYISEDYHSSAEQKSSSLLTQGVVCQRGGKYEEAVSTLTQSIEYNAASVKAYFERAYSLARLKRYQDSLQDYNVAIALEEEETIKQGKPPSMNLTTYYNNRGWAYNQLQMPERSIEDLNVALQYDPRYKNAYSNRADAYCSLKRYVDAVNDFTTAIQLSPGSALAYCNRAYAYGEMKQYDMAIADYDTAIRSDPSFANAFILRGYTFNILKRWNDAIQDFTEAMRLAPSDVRSYNNRGFSMLALKNYEYALKDLTKAIELDVAGKYENAYCHRAFLYTQIGNIEQAQEDVKKALSINPKYERCFFVQGCIYEKQGQYKLATSEFQKFLDCKPDGDIMPVEEARERLKCCESWLGKNEESSTFQEMN